MLIRDPAKRATLAVVSKHAWMRAEVPHKALSEQSKSHERLVNSMSTGTAASASASDGSEPTSTADNNPSPSSHKMNDQVLRVMQSLGIDPSRTKDSVTGISNQKYFICSL